MAERENSTALVPIEGEYLIEVKEFDQSGKSTKLATTVPEKSDFRNWSLIQRAIMLKKGPWRNSSIYEIVFATAYADNMGLDIMRGDVFSTGEGRIGISNKAKIKKAQDTGNIIGIEVEITDTSDPINLTGCKQKTDLECTATVWVKGWTKPIVRRQRLSSWFNAKNPNWSGRPEHMLELNTVAHACEYVPGATLATEGDEAPPLTPTENVTAALTEAKEAVHNGSEVTPTPKTKTTQKEK